MPNAFIIVRFVFFSLLVYLSLVSLIFASWNVHVTRLSHKAPSGAVAFVIFNSCATLILLAGGLLELVWHQAKMSLVKFECSWTAISSVFQIAVSVSVTVNSLGLMCQAGGDWGSCASANLVVLSTWFGTFTLLTYFLTLFITSVMHMHKYPEIWSTSVFAIQWFSPYSCDHGSMSKSEPEPSEGSGSDRAFRDSWGRYWPFKRRDLEAGRHADQQSQQSRQSHRPKWAKAFTIRRGVDNPFPRKDSTTTKGTLPTSPTGSALLLPPPSVRSRSSVVGRSEGSRYVELFRESILPPIPTTQSETLSYYGITLNDSSRVSNPFPIKVEDNNKPIPLPRLSKWIRADTANGINGHTIPPIS